MLSLKKDNLSYEKLLNDGEHFQNVSHIFSGFLDGKTTPCDNRNKECVSVPACCQKSRWTYNESCFTLQRGWGSGFLALEDIASSGIPL
jgi:hypothetical protein